MSVTSAGPKAKARRLTFVVNLPGLAATKLNRALREVSL